MDTWIIPIVSLALGAIAGWGAAAIKIGRYAQTVDDTKDRIDKVETEIKSMSTKITECATKIDERTQSYPSTLIKRKSPISLSEQGTRLLKTSGADKFVLENTDELIQKIRDSHPQSAYDIQEFSKDVVKSLANNENFIPFKDFAYKEGIELESIFIVMGIYLRDIALPLLGYTPEDIDQSDPQLKVA